jgi:hypothetical protein
MEQLINGQAETTLSSSINNSVTSIAVTDGSVFPSSGNFRIRCDSELMLCTARSSNTLTVTRGIESTAANSHNNAAPIYFVLTAGALSQIRADMCMTGAYASRPTSNIRTGAYYIPNDYSYLLSRWNGSAWEDFGPIKKLIPPTAAVFGAAYTTWFQQGSATLTQVGGSYIFKIPAETAGLVRAVYKTTPSTPYTIEIGLRFLNYPSNYCGGGFFWQNSSDSKHTHYGVIYHSSPGSHIGTDKYNGDGTFNSSYQTPITGNPRYGLMNYCRYFRITDNGTNRFMQYSQDGDYWANWATVGRTDFQTPDRVGLAAQVTNNNDYQMEIFHYTEY